MDGLLIAQHEAGHEADASLLLHTTATAAPLWSVAEQGVLFDNYFSAEIGGSLTNMLAMYTGSTFPLADGSKASLANLADSRAETVFDRLNESGQTWRYYEGALDQVDPQKVLNGTYLDPDESAPAAVYRTPVLGMRRFWTTPKLKANITGQDAFYRDAAAGRLPNVSFVSPSPTDSLTSNSTFAQTRLLSLLNAITKSPDWPHTAVFVVWDDWGGYYDHVRPPAGGGFRVPMILLSPWAQRGVVSSRQHDHLSILNYIVQRFGLPTLSARQASSGSFDDVLRTAPDTRRPAFDVHELPKSPVGTLRQNTLMRLLYGVGAAVAVTFVVLMRRRWSTEARRGWAPAREPDEEPVLERT
jgi:phospholipase C